ncbi:MAG: TIGR02710 family CRISPR-associated CARF protein [Candidatus Helarchaeota archaeon]
MQVKKILIIKESIPILTLPESNDDPESETLESGLLAAMNSFSKEISGQGIKSYETEDIRVTLLKKDDIFIAINSNRNALLEFPSLIRDYLFSETPELNDVDSLKKRLEYVFLPQLRPDQIDSKKLTKGLFITVGNSAAPIWYSISRHSPSFIAFLVTEQSKQIALELIKYFGFELENNAKIFVTDPNNTTKITRVSLEGIEFLKNKGLNENEIFVNSTGGTKAMTSTTFYISLLENIVNYYTKSDQARDPKQRNSDRINGDEELLLLDNPSDTLGFHYEELARESFNSLNFSRAIEYYKKLNKVFDANRKNVFRGLRELSLAYQEWDLFNFTQAVDHLNRAIKSIEGSLDWDFGEKFKDIFDKISKQYEIISRLKKVNLEVFEEIDVEVLLILYFELLNNARRKTLVKKYDDAVSRYYRFIEATAQLILLHSYKINVSKFSQTAKNLPSKSKETFKVVPFKSPFFKVSLLQDLFTNYQYPQTLALKKSWTLLESLDPEIKNKKMVENIEKVLSVRNLSILAHGWNPIKEKNITSFEKIINNCMELVLKTFTEVYPDISHLQQDLEFIKIDVDSYKSLYKSK